MEDDKFKDLLEDEELTALRLAALATKRRKEQNLNKSGSTTAQPIDSIVTSNAGSEVESNQIPFVQSHRSTHNNYSWMKQNQSQRRFPKSHRSNLIVISPVTLNDGKNSEEKAPPLILPQHKWCNSGNEDSMSPKTLRRTGPTRFNRHGSDSESSEDESDYEPSDNDSGSNETILQDEPSEHFSRLSPGCDNLSDSVEKKRRLSFQSLDSDVKSDTFDKNEATSVYKSLKSSLYSDTKQDKYAVQQHINDGEQTYNSEENRYNNCKAGQAFTNKSSDLSEDLSFKQSNSSAVTDINNSIACYSKESQSSQNFRLNDGNHKSYLDKRQSLQSVVDPHGSRNSVLQLSEGFRSENSLYSMENQCILADPKAYYDNCDKSHYLSESDLRLELKKRMQEMKSKSTCIENNETENRRYAQYNSWDRNRQRYSHKGNEFDLSSLNSFGDTQASSLYQADRTNQNFNRENDNVDHSSNFSQQRSCRSISRERSSEENFSGRDKKRSEYSFDRRRYDRSSSVDRSRTTRSSSRERKRRERSSSQDEKRRERSSSHGRIKHNSIEDRCESSSSPCRNKLDHSYKHNKSNDDRSGTEERRDWYKPSPKEKPEWSSNQERSKLDSNSSAENKNGSKTSLDRNKFSFSNSRHKEYSADDKDRYHTQSHEKTQLSNSRSRHIPNSSHDRNRREHSLSHDRSRYGSSRSPDSRSGHSSSLEKNRYSSSQEGSKDELSSSESESRYKCNSKGAYNASKIPSNQHKNKHNNVHQKTNIKENESKHDVIENCNSLQNKFRCTLNSEKIKDEESSKLNTKDQNKSIEQNKFERSNSKEKILTNTKSHQEYSSVRNSFKKRYSRSRSSSSESCSSSYSSSSSQSSRPKIRSVPSVIKPVLVKNDTDNRGNIRENKPSFGKSTNLITPQSSVHSVCTKRNLDNVEINKPLNIKCGRVDGDSKASEGKRVPVHMRLGAFPRKRVIQMPKDVEAAFVNSSSSSDDETVNTKCRRQNIRIITDMFDAKNRIDLIQQKYSSDDKPAKRPSPDIYKEKFKRMKAHR